VAGGGLTSGDGTVIVVPVGIVTPGTVTPGTVTPGVVTPGTVTPGTVTPGTVTPGTETVGVLTVGTMPALLARGSATKMDSRNPDSAAMTAADLPARPAKPVDQRPRGLAAGRLLIRVGYLAIAVNPHGLCPARPIAGLLRVRATCAISDTSHFRNRHEADRLLPLRRSPKARWKRSCARSMRSGRCGGAARRGNAMGAWRRRTTTSGDGRNLVARPSAILVARLDVSQHQTSRGRRSGRRSVGSFAISATGSRPQTGASTRRREAARRRLRTGHQLGTSPRHER
jgi:hypothetical protein